jgi:formylglycine-generating enzyme required for sulfatase activity
MDPVTVSAAILAAIAAVAADGLKEVGKKAVLDSYEALKNAIKSKFGQNSKSAKAIQTLENHPELEGLQPMLTENLKLEKVSADSEIAGITRQLIQALQETVAGRDVLQKYSIDATGATIGILGDYGRIDQYHHHEHHHATPPVKENGSVPADLEGFYLKRLIEYCDNLELTTIEEICTREGREGQGSDIRVSDVFTTLYLKDVERTEAQTVAEALLKPRGESKRLTRKEEEKKRFSIQAIEAVGATQRLVILGRPGGGKTTLVNYLATQAARLRNGMEISQGRLPGWPQQEKLLPVRIVLRRFAAWIPKDCRQGNEGLVWDYLVHQLGEWGCAAFQPQLKHTLDTSGGVIFFDGLDEVSEQDEQRTRTLIVKAIQAFAKPLKKCRVIITCRQYAYKQSDAWHLPKTEFPVVELDLFRSEQIERFAQTWYCLVGKWREWNEQKCLAEAGNLYQAIEAWPHLKELGQYPLLLTLMAQVHGRDGFLPRDRADLYDRTVKLLLVHWDNRLVRDQDGACRVEQGLIARLGFRSDTLRTTLERIALVAHEHQESASERTGCADIGKEDLRDALTEGLSIGLDQAEKVIEYIQDRAGLLQAEGNRIFRFPHRTFQEYLAAVCIMKKGDFEDYLRERVLRDMGWWREVFLLAAGSSRNTPKNIFDMVDTMLPNVPHESALTSKIAACAGLSAQAMGETEFITYVHAERANPGRYTKIHKRVQTWLLFALTADGILSPKERAAAGNALNWVEDPRFDPDRWYLPREENDGFIKIPAGEFWMGSDRKKDKEAKEREFPRHRVRLGPYAMAQYPVTVAQYEYFAQATGYPLHEYWKLINRYGNYPVVMVSWEDAKAYCRWLTEKTGKPVTLPSEGQWEMAARGTDERIYPWGDEAADTNRANYEFNIGAMSPVGIFPMGKSCFKAVDMAGNVWEWIEDDWHENYEGAANDGSSWADDPRGSFRVLRGGGWGDPARLCRAACRDGCEPGRRDIGIGFRLALPPGQ